MCTTGFALRTSIYNGMLVAYRLSACVCMCASRTTQAAAAKRQAANAQEATARIQVGNVAFIKLMY
jgi:hypothetical protein